MSKVDNIARLGQAVALLLHIFQTTLIKYVTHHSLLTTLHVLFYRTVFSLASFTILIMATIGLRNAFMMLFRLGTTQKILLCISSIFYIIATYCWHVGVSYVPINNAVAISFLVPIFVTILSYIMLKERVACRVWISLLLCIFAVLLLYTPTVSEFNVGYIILFVDVSLYAFMIIMRKKLGSNVPVIIMLYVANALMLPISVLFVPIDSLTVMYKDWNCILLLLLIGFVYVIELFVTTKVLIMAKLSILQPIKFLKIIFSLFISYLFLKEQPTAIACIAYIMIIAANLIAIGVKSR